MAESLFVSPNNMFPSEPTLSNVQNVLVLFLESIKNTTAHDLEQYKAIILNVSQKSKKDFDGLVKVHLSQEIHLSDTIETL